MKKLGLVIAVAILSSSVFADAGMPKVSLELRGQFHQDSTDVDDDTKDGEDQGFNWSFARLVFDGKASDKLSYKLRLRLEGAGFAGSTSNGDALANGVDFAKVTHKVNDKMAITLGRTKVLFGGWEGKWSSKFLFNDDSEVRNIYKGTFFRTGAHFDYNYGMGKVTVNIADDRTAQKYDAGMLTGLRWEGSFMDGALKPVISYHQDKTSAQPSSGADTADAITSTTTAFGIGWYKNGLMVEVDMATWTRSADEATGAVDANAGNTTGNWANQFSTLVTAEVKSTVLRVSKRMGQWNPIVKYVMNTGSSDGDDVVATTSYSLTAEYYPEVGNDKFRYFASTNSSTLTYEYDGATEDDEITGQMLAGFISVF